MCLIFYYHYFLHTYYRLLIYSMDVDNNYMFVNQLDIHKQKSLLKVIKKEISSDEMAYFYFYYAFASFLLAMLYYFISLICISFKINRKLTFFKINLHKFIIVCYFFHQLFLFYTVVYLLFNGVSRRRNICLYFICFFLIF